MDIGLANYTQMEKVNEFQWHSLLFEVTLESRIVDEVKYRHQIENKEIAGLRKICM